LRAAKSVSQPCKSHELRELLGECLTMTYNAVAYGQENGIDNRKAMNEFYRSLRDKCLPSCFKTAAITRACAVLKSRKKSEKRDLRMRHRKPLKPMICIISGFFITMKGRLFIRLRREEYFDMQLNSHVQETLSGRKVRSLAITPNSLSLFYSEDIESAPVKTVFGLDRNEKNITFGNKESVTQVDLSEIVRIKQTTREIVKSFRRNDVRGGRKLASKYWNRATVGPTTCFMPLQTS